MRRRRRKRRATAIAARWRLALFHARASDAVSGACESRRSRPHDGSKRTWCDRRVSTSEVASVSAPTTTCAVLMATFFSDQMTNAPRVTCASTRHASASAGLRSSERSRVMKPDVAHGCGDRERDDQRAHAMRVVNRNLRRPRGRKYASEDQREVRDRETGFRVPHRGADDDLQVNECGRGRGDEPEQVIVNRRVFGRRPAWRREKRDRDRHAEEYLRESGVRGRHRRRQEIEHCDAAQSSLQANGSQGRQAQHPHPSAALGLPDPERQHDREEPDAARDEPMAVFVEDSAHHVLHRKREHVPAVAGGPVGHGKA